MDSHEFMLVLDIDEYTEEIENVLYGGDFDDSLLTHTLDGQPAIYLTDRRSDDMERTVREAIRQAEAAGLRVARVESPLLEALRRINCELAEHHSAQQTNPSN